jgi:hypothetical protein
VNGNAKKMAALVFVAAFVGLSLFAWERVLQPSPHFHFVDLSHSFMSGRLDTDTPRRSKRDFKKAKEGDYPAGYAQAVARHTTHADGSSRGWNDWSSYRILKLKSGEELRGVFPWWDKKDDIRRNDFHDLNGQLYRINCAREVKTGCYGKRSEQLKYFVSFPPFPAVLMAPLASIWHYNLNDVWFTLFFGALNAMLLFLLLQHFSAGRHSQRSQSDNLWLTALFVFGTVHFFSAVRGEVWFTALIVGVTINLLALYCIVDLKRPILAGLLVGLGVATRTPLVFVSILVALLAVFPQGKFRREEWGSTLATLLKFAIPVAFCLAVIMVYNDARFGDPFEFGHTYLLEGRRDTIRRHGLLSSWFFGPNLSAAFLNPPVLSFDGGSALKITRHGLGLLWTTPVLLFLFWSPNRSWLFKALLITAAAVALPGLFYQNTGWEQFGYRFGLDWLPLLVLAFAVGGRALTWRIKTLILVGIAVNTFGAVTFSRFGNFYY